jgi:hypothetical protein
MLSLMPQTYDESADSKNPHQRYEAIELVNEPPTIVVKR